MVEKFGFDLAVWESAKAEMKSLLEAHAKERALIPYSRLVQQIRTVRLEPHDIRLFNMLDEISMEEDAAGRGMLSVVVVHKDGDMQPGPGFFELANRLGRDTTDVLKCWVDELRYVWRVREEARP